MIACRSQRFGSRRLSASQRKMDFHLTGSKRRTRMDVMIAAAAILAGAELATTNSDDFQAFVPHGLKLRSI